MDERERKKEGMEDQLKNGWFRETEVLWPGQALSLKIDKVLTHFKSEFQNILVFDSETYGRVLVLDGVIQLTERDEFGYQEMITHVPMFAHGQAKSVLIIGGGDGGVLREVVKHESVDKIVMCEIDPKVVETAKTYFPTSMATGFGDKRVELIHEDGAKFLQDSQSKQQKFDVIIVDSSDPVGPAESLYKEEFYNSMKCSLNVDGVICMQGENMYLHLDLIDNLLSFCSKMFPTVGYCNTLVPTYPSGSIGFVICSMATNKKLNMVDSHAEEVCEGLSPTMRYYSKAVHQAAFVIPKFAEDRLKGYFSY